jgi:ABC-type nitrate/sulfonate/bicarbonate transport system substrate-binding protein
MVKLTPRSGQITVVGVSEREEAFKQGKIDAIVTYEPNVASQP